MSLDWSIEDVENYEQITIIGDHEDPNYFEGLITKALVFGTIMTGINTIEKENVAEVFIRMRMGEAVIGVPFSRYIDGEHQDVHITLENVRRRIGLGTNAAPLSEEQFDEKIADQLRRNARMCLRGEAGHTSSVSVRYNS